MFAPDAVHVVVDEDLARTVGHAPGHRDPVRVGLVDQPAARADEGADLVVRAPTAFHRHVDLHPGGAARLRVAGQTELRRSTTFTWRATASTSSYV